MSANNSSAAQPSNNTPQTPTNQTPGAPPFTQQDPPSSPSTILPQQSLQLAPPAPAKKKVPATLNKKAPASPKNKKSSSPPKKKSTRVKPSKEAPQSSTKEKTPNFDEGTLITTDGPIPTGNVGVGTEGFLKQEVEVKTLQALTKKYEETTRAMTELMKEAEEVLGSGVSHHKKAWSGTESLFKTSVSRWEEQLSNAQSEIIILENEPEVILPLLKFKKRTASSSAPVNPPAPKKSRPSLPSQLLGNDLLSTFVEGGDLNQIAEDAKSLSGGSSDVDMSLISDPDDPQPSGSALPPAGSAPPPPPSTSALALPTPSGPALALPTPSGPALALPTPHAPALSGSAPLPAGSQLSPSGSAVPMDLDGKNGDGSKAMDVDGDSADVSMAGSAGKGDGSKAKDGKKKGKGPAKEKAPPKERGIPVEDKYRQAVSALDICKGDISSSEKMLWSQNLAFLTPGSTTRPAGKVGLDVGAMMADMVGCVIQAYQGDQPYLKTLSDSHRLAPEYFPNGLLDAPHSDDFGNMLKTAPRLTQVSHPDMFWNQDNINFEPIHEASLICHTAVGMSQSWVALLLGLSRTNSNLAYVPTGSHSLLLKYGLSRINQALIDSIGQASLSVQPKQLPSHAPSELKFCRDAAEFLSFRINGLGPAVGGQGQRKETSTEGLHFLMKKIHQLLLALSLCYEAAWVARREKEIVERNSDLPADQLTLLKTNLSKTNVYSSGTSGMKSGRWTVMKKEAFSSLVVFLLYGVAGWWTMFTNYRKMNYSDIYGMMTIAKMKAKAMLETEPGTDLESSHPLLSGAWSYLNSYIIQLILNTNYNSPSPDWENCLKTWTDDLSTTHVSRLLVADVFSELRTPGTSMTPSGTPAPPVQPDTSTLDKTMTEVIKMIEDTLNPDIQKTTGEDKAAEEAQQKAIGGQKGGGDGEEDGGEDSNQEEDGEEEDQGEEGIEWEEVDIRPQKAPKKVPRDVRKYLDLEARVDNSGS
ncbi:hypothetical protein PCANC_14249 [Puccinia coronata f. sp. avenae]|uniref:Golgi to ER traffic-protein n=1 Tax=Puccinia coronata f. sp. avenae TaxID=200324 RepID=A0A2N5UQ86_9BASI|nr:hypothetical protein PCANC_14249 [Puccinia coronata f. sp. avenae]